MVKGANQGNRVTVIVQFTDDSDPGRFLEGRAVSCLAPLRDAMSRPLITGSTK
jgi:hypothetical protein